MFTYRNIHQDEKEVICLDCLSVWCNFSSQVERCAALSERLDLFQVLLDHPDALEQLKKRPLKGGRRWHVWMKLDCGNGRGSAQGERDSTWPRLILCLLCCSRSPALGPRGAQTCRGHRSHGRRGAHRRVCSLWEHLQVQRSGADTGSCPGNHRLDSAVHGKVSHREVY